MNESNFIKHFFLCTAATLLLIALGTNPAWGMGGQRCEEPYCGGTLQAAPLLTIFGAAHHQVSQPAGLDNPALLNLESGSTGSETLFDAAFQINSSGVTQIGGTAVDSNGNTYVTGGFTGTLLCPGVTLTSTSDYDVFLAKLDPNGTCLWARMAQGNASLASGLSMDGGLSVAVDQEGHCYVGGAFVKSLAFVDPNGNIITELSDGRGDSRINFEMFIAKYDTAGTLLWARGGQSGSAGEVGSLGVTDLNVVTTVILDSEGYPYIGGSYSGTDFLGEVVLPKGKADFFIASLDIETGDPYWVKTGGTPDFDGVMSLSMDSYGYINGLGYIGQGTLILPDYISPDPYVNESGVFDTGIIGYDINGEWYFALLIGADVNIRGRDIASDPLGNIFVTGDFEGTASLVGSDLEITATGSDWNGYLVKYDLNGYAQWARQFSSEARVLGSRVVVDDAGNSFVLGVFYSQVVLGEEGDHPVTLFADGESDMFIAMYDPNGTLQWAKQIDGSGTEALDQVNSSLVHVATNPTDLLYDNGSLILSGDFNKQLSLGNGITLATGEDNRAGFVARLKLPQDSPTPTDGTSDDLPREETEGSNAEDL